MQKLLGFLCIFLAVLGAANGIEPGSVETQIANLVIQHPDQGRSTMVYDPRLNLVARAKALDLGRRNYFAHVDPDGYGPNKAAELAGFDLPDWWGDALNLNYIESIAGGYANAQAAFDGWMASAGHKRHILAETSFYAEQTRYGIGYAEVPGSTYVRYYVFVSAPPETGGTQALEPYSEWLFGYFTPKGIDTNGDLGDDDGDGIPLLTEFALGYNPMTRDILPAPILNTTNHSLDWLLPIRSDLGSITVLVERSTDLLSWSTTGAQRTGNTFSVDTQSSRAFMRLRIGVQ